MSYEASATVSIICRDHNLHIQTAWVKQNTSLHDGFNTFS
jgi:hypothetical protein